MRERQARLTITVDSRLLAYAQQLVDDGRATSVSAAFGAAMAELAYRHRRQRTLWKLKSAAADHDRVARMLAYADEQLDSSR